jgi:hypothetical protein
MNTIFNIEPFEAKRVFINEYTNAKEYSSGQLCVFVTAIQNGQIINNIIVSKVKQNNLTSNTLGGDIVMIEWGYKRFTTIKFVNEIDAKHFADKILKEYKIYKNDNTTI